MPVEDLFLEVFLDGLCVRVLLVVDVDQFLKADQFSLVLVVLVLNSLDFVFFGVQLFLFLNQLFLQVGKFLFVGLNFGFLYLKIVLHEVIFDDAVGPLHHVTDPV